MPLWADRIIDKPSAKLTKWKQKIKIKIRDEKEAITTETKRNSEKPFRTSLKTYIPKKLETGLNSRCIRPIKMKPEERNNLNTSITKHKTGEVVKIFQLKYAQAYMDLQVNFTKPSKKN